MKMRFLLYSLLLFLFALPASSQTFSLGSDFMSRYVWRGYDFGESLSIQPALTFSAGGFEIGSWASYSVSADGAGANEHDLWLGYTIATPTSGSFSIGLTDYYFPSPDGLGFFDFDGDGDGAHWIEPSVSYTGPDTFPISLYGAAFVHNDPDNSIYLQAAYPFTVDSVELGLTAGAITGESAFYGTTGFAVVNLGLTATKSIQVTDSFALPLSVSYILNPDTERTFLVVGISL